MAVIARIVGLSLFIGLLGAVLPLLAFGSSGSTKDYAVISLAFSCVGAIVGAVAGAANEIVATRTRSRPPANPPDSN
jgi:hypothetical protein